MVRYTAVLTALFSLAWAPGAVFAQPEPNAVAAPKPETRAERRAQFEVEGQGFFVEFVRRGADAELRFGSSDAVNSVTVPFTDYEVALAILADRRIEPLWSPILAWAGPDLGLMRARAIETARAAAAAAGSVRPPRTTSESEVSPRRLALLQYALALRHNGRVADAIALLRTELAAIGRRSGRERLDRSIFVTTLGSSLRMNGDLEGALRTLSEGEAALAGTGFALNLSVNRAAYLAESGRYAEALALIERVGGAFRPGNGHAIPGSERHFTWIRACALQGLGRTAEARNLFATIGRDPIVNRGFHVVQSGQSIRVRALNCMKDSEGLVVELLGLLAGQPMAPSLFVVLQPAFRSPSYDPQVMAQVRLDPRIQAALRDIMRTLPAQLDPALRN